ncbi:MAG: ABC transporter substrate-binding protein [Defluviitaleaceae bacterium]|nr:ABC transporter substrate-binding protein [Defluviitaleaceae bacterium]
MRRAKRVLALLLALLFLSMTACNDKPPEPPAPTGDSSVGTPTNGETPTPPDSTTPVDRSQMGNIHPIKDFGGRTLRIGAWWDTPISALAWGDEPDRATSNNYALARLMWDNARRVEEQFNVKFEAVAVPYGNLMDTLNASVLERNPFADVVILDGDWIMDAIGTVIQPWDNANLPNSDLFGDRVYISPCTSMDGGTWTINQNGADAEAFGLGVNLNIINMEGLPNPIELYENGEWTWEAMLDIMRRATRDTTGGGGVFNQFGIAGQPGEIVQHLIGTNDGMLVDADMNYGYAHPNTIRALEFAKLIFEERLWHAEAGGHMDTGNYDRNFYSGLREGVAALFPTITWAIQNVPPAFELGFVPFPIGPDNTTGSTWLAGFKQGMGVTVGTSWDVGDILILIEELHSWPGDDTDILYESGQIEWMREQFPTEGDVQRAIISGLTRRTDVGRAIEGYYWVLGDFASHFWLHEMDVLQAVEHHRNERQEMLDIRFKR